MSLSETPNLTSPPRVPYEIFLDIIEFLILEQVEVAEPMDYVLEYNKQSEARIVVSTEGEHHDHFERLNRLRNLLHIDSRSRRMVSKDFLPIPMVTSKRRHDRYPFVARVCPAVDIFTLQESYEIDFLFAAIMLPTAKGSEIVRNIITVQGADTMFFQKNSEGYVDALASLPNLRKIIIPAGNYRRKEEEDRCKCSRSESHPEFTKIDEDHFPWLAEWEKDHGHIARKLGPQFKKRNIYIFAGSMDRDMFELELDITEEAIRVKSSCRNCDCCDCWVEEVCLGIPRECRIAEFLGISRRST
ncbi:hypothetical protein CSAL01_07500 [Colletotrichum salicis]|uniref:Uncharacterized protein n=1 Tax=Colletotrichum salicis TaxID=1209931 RepID=A0A135SW24_9PEZI|nr:hypothetical protein CSAL01_07500 [Colletotrichum salicis]